MKLFKFTKEFLLKPEHQFIILVFIVWRIWILVFALAGFVFVPLASKDFLGGSIDNYLNNPLFWSWSNFDGEHYMAIAQRGYKALEHSFFPLYPLIVGLFSNNSLENIAVIGLVISNIAFVVGLFLFWYIIRFDFSKEVATLALLSFVVFPTSFYFGALYTESLFFVFSICSFLLIRKSFWFLSGLAGGLASVTKIYGVLLLPAFIAEWWKVRREGVARTLPLLPICLVGLGFGIYLVFLYATTGSPLSFYSELAPFGQQRGSGNLVLLPQVFWRYVKMLFTVDRSSPIYLTLSFEFFSAIFAGVIIGWGFFKKVRLSYLIFAALAYILPSLTGSFSSLPRYIVTIFPIFILLGMFFAKRRLTICIIYFLVSLLLLGMELALFTRGYWVA